MEKETPLLKQLLYHTAGSGSVLSSTKRKSSRVPPSTGYYTVLEGREVEWWEKTKSRICLVSNMSVDAVLSYVE